MSAASGGMTTIQHPQVGRLELRYEKLAIAGGEGVTLVIFHAEPDSPWAQSLQRLATMARGSRLGATRWSDRAFAT